jgi:hypothetical protein
MVMVMEVDKTQNARVACCVILRRLFETSGRHEVQGDGRGKGYTGPVEIKNRNKKEMTNQRIMKE